MSRFFPTLILAAAIAFSATPAFADPQTPASITVRSDDLDLNSERGAARMLRRIERAANIVCGASVAATYSGQRDEYRTCRAATIAASVHQLGADQVSALHAQRYGAGESQIAVR